MDSIALFLMSAMRVNAFEQTINRMIPFSAVIQISRNHCRYMLLFEM